MSIRSQTFYSEYHGHKVEDLEQLHQELKKSTRNFIFLAGDSSLDNKFWFPDRADAVNGYENILRPAISKQDICYWINRELVERNQGSQYVAVNCAVEESSLGERSCGRLLPQDHFLRSHTTSEDIAIVSVGGNDIALKVNPCTILNLLTLHCCSTTTCLQHTACGTPLPCDDYCCGSTTSCVSNLFAFPPGYGYFLHLFHTKIKYYILNLTNKVRPKIIMVCMIYFLDEMTNGSWADAMLSFLNYNSNPIKLQTIISKIFEHATRLIEIPGCKVIPVPLFEALNGKLTEDYVQRVEPSAMGGQKIAKLFLDLLDNENGSMRKEEQGQFSSPFYDPQMNRG